MNIEEDISGAAVKFPPPLVFLILMLSGYCLQHFWPVGIGISSGLKYVGFAVAVAGIGFILLTGRTFKRAETSIEPWKPTTRILTTGVYAYSRNPIYVALCLVPIGIGIFLNSLWMLVSFVPSAFLVYHIAIRKEEVYLERKFGEEYLRYKSRVRRWL